jgi:hypothetical protein
LAGWTNAQITIDPFVATVGSSAIANCTPVPNTINVASQGQQYQIYYFDPTFAGGNVVPIATQLSSDYSNVGNFLIGSVITPIAGVGGVIYRPSMYSDSGDITTTNAPYAYDALPSTNAVMQGKNTALLGPVAAACTFSGFAANVTTATSNLNVIASLSSAVSANPSAIGAQVSGSPYSMLISNTTIASTHYTLTIPPGTDLSTITVEGVAGAPLSTTTTTIRLQISDINIQ